MKRLIVGVVLAMVLTLVFAGGVLAADPQGEAKGICNLGQEWTDAVEPGLRDDSVHTCQSHTGDTPLGVHFNAYKRGNGLIPGWAMNGVPGPHQP